MKRTKELITLPEGRYHVECDVYDDGDLESLREIYKEWRSLCFKLNALNARSINLPEGLSEISFCYYMNCLRINNPKLGSKVNTSFDAYSVESQKRIQIKACSVLPDLTSFGPKTQWDELYFLDFFKKGAWDFSFDIYLIPSMYIYSQSVNTSATMKDFQEAGKRPRFSIFKEIIKKNDLKPIRTCNLYETRAEE